MAYYMKQDFSPPILSRRWLAIQCRPNMVVNNRQYILRILESGLLFREDSADLEQEGPSPEDVLKAAGVVVGGWLTRGEAFASAAIIGTCVYLFPPRSFSRRALLNLVAYVSIPLALRTSHRQRCTSSLGSLLKIMRNYVVLSRRAAACLKEYAALHGHVETVSSTIQSMHTLLCRQQCDLGSTMSRVSSSLLNNAPWLRSNVAWAPLKLCDNQNLLRIHHAFLVIQSSLLKNLALIHLIPSPDDQQLYKNYNERIFWLHTVLLPHLEDVFKENYESLERMYRLLKNLGTRATEGPKKLGDAVTGTWLYSEVHTSVVKACLELKLVLSKCNSLDMFLDSCAVNGQDLDVNLLYKDFDGIIDNLSSCLSNIHKAQIRLKNINKRVTIKIDQTYGENAQLTVQQVAVVNIADLEPECRDEVYYLINTGDDVELVDAIDAIDLTTVPGDREKENTKMVLIELKRALGKREVVMRERERQALLKTMPELENCPELEKEIFSDDEDVNQKGYIKKIKTTPAKQKAVKYCKINSRKCSVFRKVKKIKLQTKTYNNENIFKNDLLYLANTKYNIKRVLLTFSVSNKNIIMTRWFKRQSARNDYYGVFNDRADLITGAIRLTTNQAFNVDKYKCTKRDLELSSTSDSDDSYHLFKDLKTRQVYRKKYHPCRQGQNSNNKKRNDAADESSKPIEYRFGTGMSMASILQMNNTLRLPSMSNEEVFAGDGEVSDDSGNDD